MLISYNWLKEFIPDLTENSKEVAESLSYTLAEVDEVTQNGNDFLLEIENKALGHRADLFGQLGLSREVAASLKKGFVIPRTRRLENTSGELDSETEIEITLANPKLSQRYSAVIIKNIKLEPSPQWLQDRLNAVGIRAINNIVDITNYMMYKHGQALHAFDLDELLKNQKSENNKIAIEVRTAREGESLTLLDESELNLTVNDLVIAHKTDTDNYPVALAGIMGGQSCEIRENTTSILLESANFDMFSIRSSSRNHAIRSEASLRFEKGQDPEMTVPVLQEAVEMITGNTDFSTIVDEYQPLKSEPTEIQMTTEYINQYLHTTQSEKDILNKLNSLGFTSKVENGTITTTVPSFRKDVKINEDLLEEVGRIYNYNNIEPTLPTRLISPPADNQIWRLKNEIRDMLAKLGLNEVLNYSFVDKEMTGQITKINSDNSMSLTKEFDPEQLKLRNPIAPEFAYMRTSLIPSLKINTIENAKRFDEFGLYELNLTTHPSTNDGSLPVEPNLLSLVWYSRKQKQQVAFTQAKAIWKTLLKILGILNDLQNLIPMEIKLTDTKGAPASKGSAWGYEIDIATLLEARTANKFKHIPSHMPTMQDLSFVVDQKEAVGEIFRDIENLEIENLVQIELIDTFQNQEMQKEKQKSITVRLTFQHPDRNLSDKEISPLREQIENLLVNSYAATIR